MRQLTAAHLDGLSVLASHALRPDRLEAFVFDGTLQIRGSHRLPFGRWLNLASEVETDGSAISSVRLDIGALHFSPRLSRILVDAAISSAWLVGMDIPPLDEAVPGLRIGSDSLLVSLDLPKETGILSRIARSQSRGDPSMVAATYCRLEKEQKANPQADFAEQVRRAFAYEHATPITAGTNRAAFIALAMLVVDRRAGLLAGVDGAMIAKCPDTKATYLIHGRSDLPKHWALSGALSAGSGRQIAEAIGEWKELADSLSRQSQFSRGDPTGFSFVDLSADRAGFLTAEMGGSTVDPQGAAARLARASANDILPAELLMNEEGPNSGFAAKYGNIDDPRYAAAVARIDAILYRRSILRDWPR